MLGDFVTRVLPGIDLAAARASAGPEDRLDAPGMVTFVVGYPVWIDIHVLEVEFGAAGRYLRHRLRRT
jgi:hypothetical protein